MLEQVFRDISAKVINTRVFNKASEISGYFQALPDGLHPTDHEPKSKAGFKDAEVKDDVSRPRQPAPKPPTKVPPKVVKPPPLRTTLAPPGHPFKPPHTSKGQQLLREASRVSVVDLPLASAYILRAFLEHTVDTYMIRHSLPFREGPSKEKQLELSVRAERVIQHLIASKAVESKFLSGAKRVLTGSSDSAGIKALNDYHHDQYQVPAADALRTGWDSSVGLFVAVYGAAA